jgi:hypothetical protein
LNKEVTVRFVKLKNAAVGFDVLTTCQPNTVWCSRERLPAAAAQPAKVRQSCSATWKYQEFLDVFSLTAYIVFEGFLFFTCEISGSHGSEYEV